MARPHRRRKGPEELDFSTLSFSQVIECDERLAELRRSYARKPAEERRAAADWAYHAEGAATLFGQALAGAGHDRVFSPTWPPGIESLAIDPTYAPDLLEGWSYSLAKLGRPDEAVAIQRRALALAPQSSALLSDLGWALTESGQYDEAERVLKEAVRLAPADYDRPRNNLEELRRRRRGGREGRRRTTDRTTRPA